MWNPEEKDAPGRVFVVTGGNRGIGLEVSRRLAAHADPADVVYLCSRSVYRGEDAQDALQNEGYSVTYQQLDVEDEESVQWLASFLSERHGGVDVLVNNAGVAFPSNCDIEDVSVEEQTERAVNVNFFGTLRVCEAMFPLLRPNARVVNVSSQAGHMALARMNRSLRQRFLSPDIDIELLSILMREFVDVVGKQDGDARGWPCTYYGVAKLGVTILTSLLQRQLDTAPDNKILINAVCPGFCSTRLSAHRGPRRPEDGADVIVWAALLRSYDVELDKDSGDDDEESLPRGAFLVDDGLRVPLDAASLPVMSQTKEKTPPKRNSEFFTY